MGGKDEGKGVVPSAGRSSVRHGQAHMFVERSVRHTGLWEVTMSVMQSLCSLFDFAITRLLQLVSKLEAAGKQHVHLHVIVYE
jgi:hypothetical protein